MVQKNLLILSYVNTCGENSIVDDLHLPNLGISYFRKSETLQYYSWVNTIKQEYNLARYLIYQADISKNEISPHESQEFNIIINTLDYPAVGFGTEILKQSLKNSYSVLDKIGLICNHFFKLEKASARVNFTDWCNKIEKEVALNSSFASLYWLGKDFDNKEGSLKNIRMLRNAIEHRYVRVVAHSLNSIDDELANTENFEYVISYSDLEIMAFKTLNIVRSAIFYLVNGFNSLYINAVSDKDKTFIPLTLSIYEDEWKN